MHATAISSARSILLAVDPPRCFLGREIGILEIGAGLARLDQHDLDVPSAQLLAEALRRSPAMPAFMPA
jgi:hypothetical protein